MKIEEEIFKRCKINYSKLILYGFKKENSNYTYSEKIMDEKFRVDITITKEGKVSVKVFDLLFNDEYTNYRIEDEAGKFAYLIKEKIENILKDIKQKCTIPNYFITNQANRITNLIKEKYNDIPEFAWEKSPGYGIFRNPANKKWYGLIMNINKNKLDSGDYEVEIINVKLDENKILELLDKAGFYKAYHMNKKNWISIILDDTLSDKKIMSYIIQSHKFTEKEN